MASGATPRFHNDMGVPVIEIGAHELMCIGAKPPFDHPHVFLDMGAANEIICPYCSTLYKFNGRLTEGSSSPSEAAWHDEAA
ncbi:MAG: zinc-finger domain-containing protein [Rhizobiales bacterium]|nr:zinc-finger domain-containing protein [Hyphomicrobiales bacterium]